MSRQDGELRRRVDQNCKKDRFGGESTYQSKLLPRLDALVHWCIITITGTGLSSPTRPARAYPMPRKKLPFRMQKTPHG